MFSMPPATAAVDDAEPDLLRRRGDGLGARTADAVDGHCRDVDREAAMDGRLPGRVHLVAGLDDIAHDDTAELPGVETGAAECLPQDSRSELGGGVAFSEPP